MSSLVRPLRAAALWLLGEAGWPEARALSLVPRWQGSHGARPALRSLPLTPALWAPRALQGSIQPPGSSLPMRIFSNFLPWVIVLAQ